MWVSFALNRLSHRYFLWHGSVFKKIEKKWDSLDRITNSLWIMKLNAYETIEWNFVLRESVSSKFHFILYVLKITPWNYPLRLMFVCGQLRIVATNFVRWTRSAFVDKPILFWWSIYIYIYIYCWVLSYIFRSSAFVAIRLLMLIYIYTHD
jgi:hypothetical protein